MRVKGLKGLFGCNFIEIDTGKNPDDDFLYDITRTPSYMYLLSMENITGNMPILKILLNQVDEDYTIEDAEEEGGITYMSYAFFSYLLSTFKEHSVPEVLEPRASTRYLYDSFKDVSDSYNVVEFEHEGQLEDLEIGDCIDTIFYKKDKYDTIISWVNTYVITKVLYNRSGQKAGFEIRKYISTPNDKASYGYQVSIMELAEMIFYNIDDCSGFNLVYPSDCGEGEKKIDLHNKAFISKACK